MRDGRQNANWAWAGRQKFRGGEASKIYKEKGKPIGTKLTAWLSKPLTASSFGSLSLLLAAIFPDNSFWCLLFVWTSFSPFHFFLLTSFLMMPLSLDLVCPWHLLLFTALPAHSFEARDMTHSSPDNHSLLSHCPSSRESVSTSRTFSFSWEPFLLIFPSLATIKNMEAATLDHKLQWHSEASNAKNSPAQRWQWAKPSMSGTLRTNTVPHIDAETHFCSKKTYGFVRFPPSAIPWTKPFHCDLPSLPGKSLPKLLPVSFHLSTPFSSYIFRITEFRRLNFLWPYLIPPISHAHPMSLCTQNRFHKPQASEIKMDCWVIASHWLKTNLLPGPFLYIIPSALLLHFSLKSREGWREKINAYIIIYTCNYSPKLSMKLLNTYIGVIQTNVQFHEISHGTAA